MAKIRKYGMAWDTDEYHDHACIELEFIRKGGYIQHKKKTRGNGLFFHWKAFQDLIWPDQTWQHWRTLMTEEFLKRQYLAILGCAASGKTKTSALNALTDWYAFPDCTTTICSSTDLPSLDRRIWGEIVKLHRSAKAAAEWIPGHLIEGRRTIINDPHDEFLEGREFKNGLMGVACKRGQTFVGLSNLVGIHNKRVRVFGDELSLMPKSFLDSSSNLSKCEDFKLIGKGNPNETTNALGILAEPAVELGGWESGIDQSEMTKTWKTRYPNGIAIQLPGPDSPNMRVAEDQPVPFPYLMTRKQMEDDAQIWGRDDWHFAMMNLARMPRGQGSRRVLTRQKCEQFGATLEPFWQDTNLKTVAFLDAAYRGVGGDRCIFGTLTFGREVMSDEPPRILTQLALGRTNVPQGRQIIALNELTVIPISSGPEAIAPEDQIATFCMNACQQRNIPPQLFMYDAGMRTSLVTAFSRIWSPLVTSIDFGGTATDQPVSADIKKLCKDHYFNFVTELWFSMALCVEARQFRGLTQSAMWEFCAREWKHRPGTNKIQVETKTEMKEKCFVAGTLIATPNGNVKIETLNSGDLVCTPFGSSRVYSILQRESRAITTLELSNGQSLSGTSDHKIFTWDKGWQSMDTLSLHSKTESIISLWKWQFLNLLFTKIRNTSFKQLVDIISEKGTRNIPNRRSFYTGLFGQIILGQYQKENIFTTLMEIGKTISSAIFDLLIPKDMQAITSNDVGKILNLGKPQWHGFQSLSDYQPFGTDQTRDGNGTERTYEQCGQSKQRKRLFVASAKNHFGPIIRMLKCVQKSVLIRNSHVATMMFLKHVHSAAKSFWEIVIQSPPIVLSHVRQAPSGKPEKVYNLTLEKHNAYYANGLLVANCSRSPDEADGIVIGLYCARRNGFQIARIAARPQRTRFNPYERDWKAELQKKSAELANKGSLETASATG